MIGEERPLSVSALTRTIASRLAELGSVAVTGEITQGKVSSAGHYYATLKDAEAVLPLVLWRSQLVRQGRPPQDGDRVVVRGRIEVYAPRGSYQLIVQSIRPLGVGELLARLEALRQRLEVEGLFAAARKRPLPFLPRAVGLATAAGSAALADLLHGLRTRFPGMAIIHAPCQVQGAAAAASIVEALDRLARHPLVDVIIVGRGGGSLEDLWAFNEEPVVRAIASCRKPVVCAVGHESDTVLADFAADCRAKTPTAAADLVVPDRRELEARLDEAQRRLWAGVNGHLHHAGLRLAALASHRALAVPAQTIATQRWRLEELAERLHLACTQTTARIRARLEASSRELALAHPARLLQIRTQAVATGAHRLATAQAANQRRHEDRWRALASRLEALSPLAVLTRGYALVRTTDGPLQSIHQTVIGATLQARLVDGSLEAVVTTIRPQ